MRKSSWWRFIVAVLVLTGAVLLALGSTPKLGLDLSGGTQITLEASSTDTVEANAENTDRAVEVLRGRVDALGVTEPTLVRSGENRILIELPGLEDPREAAEVIGRTARLTFHPVLGVDPSIVGKTGESSAKDKKKDGDTEDGEDPEAPTGGQEPETDDQGRFVTKDEDGGPLVLGPSQLEGDDVDQATAGIQDQGVQWVVDVEFAKKGQDAWASLTGDAACFPQGDPQRRIAIMLDGEVISSPQVQDSSCDVGQLGGRTQISGSFTESSAQNLALLIEGGALPLPVEIISQQVVGPTLGDEAIDASVKAGLLGLLLTGLFITFAYRLSGFLAVVALGCYALISYAILVLLGATLTLPGLAGFVLAIGMAIDANVLVFERAKEESSEAGSTPARAISTGFSKAWSAILDSNVTTLLAGGLLFFLATGPVRGFGVTLTIGVIASMFSAMVISRVLVEFATSRKAVRRRPGLTGFAKTGRVHDVLLRRNPDVMGRSRIWLALSSLVVVAALLGIVLNGLNLGVEFTGGRVLDFTTTTSATKSDVETVRSDLGDAGFDDAVVQTSGDGDLVIKVGDVDNDEAQVIRDLVAEAVPGSDLESDSLIGPSLGDELRTKALIALGIALAAQMLYLALRFRWVFGASAAIAMLHDVSIVIGVFAWLGRPVDGVFLAAILTVIGLSVNDTVVVFDRVREKWRGTSANETFAASCNEAVLATVPRTVNTGLGTMFILAALYFLGGDSLTDFALALLIGLVVGTYSSVFTATPLAVLMHRVWPVEPRTPREKRPERTPDDSGAVI
ncbi:bifunctional preprotein translocase subunit SecD/SecF [Nocardioides dokdonensis FR1436]|uniref:Multifunctional fusion protein n=1 Tax=Nocardioides dokdonensis FR1436 TaxID=1300347 RepID=A0A1A9GNC1_9ACTN|nr:protein translocase subunit SecD [Nocardioides dokdonensis]ANH39784.1 bifunctional preprotein translocase subunit SecD/SecF [Nocardioides dokdonensis FR1436]